MVSAMITQSDSAICCLQAYISRARVDSFSLTADMMYVASNAPRISRALFEIAARRKWNSAAGLLLEVCKVWCSQSWWGFVCNSLAACEAHCTALNTLQRGMNCVFVCSHRCLYASMNRKFETEIYSCMQHYPCHLILAVLGASL